MQVNVGHTWWKTSYVKLLFVVDDWTVHGLTDSLDCAVSIL